ncbi:MAG: precorrin-6y C5,15-methyltransferase (decarboxylating) subunit CbiE [Clostridia bacterium]|jgi:precorrin-6y C5,15-methyltransferase (decarboxylating) CbiE subunit|nr:precorrin-6y C5,15-methyltransferase (decarboxylating) subunit CbiE [Clostridia bacterium]
MAAKIKQQQITIIGMGPGSREYLPPISLRKIQQADILVGGKRHLEQFPELKVDKQEITKNLTTLKEYIMDHYQKKNVTVLVSGDPGFYSLLTFLSKHFDRDILEVIPGISSLQLAFSKLAMPWQDAQLISLHGKDLQVLRNYLSCSKLCLLTDNINTPQTIAKVYLDTGFTEKIIYTCENLSYPDEVIQQYSVISLCKESRNMVNCVVIICDAE